MKKFKYIPVFLLFPVLSTFSQYLPTGSQAVDFSARTEAGEDFTLSGLKGKYVLLDFTGSLRTLLGCLSTPYGSAGKI